MCGEINRLNWSAVKGEMTQFDESVVDSFPSLSINIFFVFFTLCTCIADCFAEIENGKIENTIFIPHGRGLTLNRTFFFMVNERSLNKIIISKALNWCLAVRCN